MQQAPKRNPANEPLDPDVVEKLGKMFLLITSPSDGEALTALRMFNRALEANGVDYHTLVARMAKPWLSDGSKEQFRGEIANARALGRSEGMREAEAKRGVEDGFVNADGSDDWRQLALYIDREKHRLSSRDQTDWCREFISDMATTARLVSDYQPSPRQLVQLHRFFVKLGGKIT
jgi:hypothetical protein